MKAPYTVLLDSFLFGIFFMLIKKLIRTVPDYPKPGIMFRDITTLIKDPIGLNLVVKEFCSRYARLRIDKVVGIESRGFIIGAPIAYELGVGFIPIRKKGKLPAKTIGCDYALEYGTDRIEVHSDAILEGENILLIDDLTPARVAFVTRLGEGLIPDEHTVLQQGDLVHVMVSDTDLARTEEILASTPEGERA